MTAVPRFCSEGLMRWAPVVVLGAIALAFTSMPAAGRAPSTAIRIDGLVRRLQDSRRYIKVQIIWRRQAGESGPDAIIEGEWGGSLGVVDLYAPYGPKPSQTRKLTLPKADGLVVHASRSGPEFDAPFVVGFFNDAPNAGSSSVPLPIVWRLDDFQVDMPALINRRFSDQDLRFRRIAAYSELNTWASNLNRSDPIYPAPSNALGGTPVTVQALIDLMLTGHVIEAKAILDQSWPTIAERTDVHARGEKEFWNDLARSLEGNSLWKRFNLARLPEAGLIEAAATASGRAVARL